MLKTQDWTPKGDSIPPESYWNCIVNTFKYGPEELLRLFTNFKLGMESLENIEEQFKHFLCQIVIYDLDTREKTVNEIEDEIIIFCRTTHLVIITEDGKAYYR